RVMRNPGQNDGDLIEAKSLLQKHGCIEKSLAMAQAYADKARLALAEAPDHPLRALLDDLADYTVSRSS
ncbi:MAG: polyprenyl synthetase family protein, partial [Alphaproteobacteria bacterium]|nr:polyprenyl synthetase family protein [Alphaproteobacteria bacterium]